MPASRWSLPVAFYREAFAAIERMRPASVIVKHSFQTNGMLIDAEWCRLFRNGTSASASASTARSELHDRHRKTRSGKGTFDKTLAGIRCLAPNGVPFHVISVLSRDSLAMPDELLDFYLSEGIDQICFNVEESEGDHVSDLLPGPNCGRATPLSCAASGTGAGERPGEVRARDRPRHAARVPARGSAPRNIQTEPLAMLNVDSHGNVSSFSPELLGLRTSDYGDFLLGNINHQSLAEIHRDLPRLGAAPRHPGGRAGVQRELRLFLGLRRRRAGEQAVRERLVRQHDDVILHADADGADRPDPGGL